MILQDITPWKALSSSISSSLRHVILFSTHFKEHMAWKTRTRTEKWWMVSSLIHDLNYRQSLKDGSLHLLARSVNTIPPFRGSHLILADKHDLQFNRLATTPELSLSPSTTSHSSYFSFVLYLISSNLVDLSGLVNFVEEIKHHTS